MIILDLRNKIVLSKIEKLKVLLHVIKICYIYKFKLIVQTHTKTIRLNSIFKRDNLTSNVIFTVKPYTRLIVSNLEELLEELSKLKEPTIIIAQVIYQHNNNKIQIVHLPKVSKFVLKDLDYVNEIGIIAGILNKKDTERFIHIMCDNVNRIVKFDENLKYHSYPFPVKVIQKTHKLSLSGKDSINNFRINKEVEKNKISVIIPTTLNKVDNYFTLPSLLNQVSEILSLIQVNFEIILVVGPEVNQSALKQLVETLPDVIIVTESGLFNFSRRVNKGLNMAKNEIIWVLNDDIRISNHESSKEDLLIAIQLTKNQKTGVVGTFLVEGGLINHAGIQIHDEVADHVLRGSQFSKIEAMNTFRVREVTGVTGANIFFLKKTIEYLGMFDETFPAEFSDVEICLRANKNDLQNYVIRTKNFTHFESSTRVNSPDPRHQLLRTLSKYEMEYKDDPYNFTVPYCCLQDMKINSTNLNEIINLGKED
jgi:GT2 family glycosyltransferase